MQRTETNSNSTSWRIVFLLLCCCSLTSLAQELKPMWLKSTPCPANGTYEFKVLPIQGGNLKSARKQIPDAIAYYMERTYDISGVTVETFELSSQDINGKTQSHQVEKICDTTYTESEALKIRLSIIDEYKAKDCYWFLCTVSKPYVHDVIYDKIEVSTKYGAAGLWRSAIVPVWGQMHKGSYLKGGLIMGGIVAGAAGIAAAETQRGAYISKIGQTHDSKAKKFYANKADNLATVRNVCIGKAAAVYLYGLIDAIVAPGAKRVIVTPAVYENSGYGLSANIAF